MYGVSEGSEQYECELIIRMESSTNLWLCVKGDLYMILVYD